MPPSGPLKPAEVEVLSTWVKLGAPWGMAQAGQPASPGAAPSRGGQPATPHWAFRPVQRPPVPRVRDRAWVKTPVVAFILAELEKRGLNPAPPADRRTLIRRAFFDLTGLPPTAEEIEAFAGDRSPDAWERVVNRLLA